MDLIFPIDVWESLFAAAGPEAFGRSCLSAKQFALPLGGAQSPSSARIWKSFVDSLSLQCPPSASESALVRECCRARKNIDNGKVVTHLLFEDENPINQSYQRFFRFQWRFGSDIQPLRLINDPLYGSRESSVVIAEASFDLRTLQVRDFAAVETTAEWAPVGRFWEINAREPNYVGLGEPLELRDLRLMNTSVIPLPPKPDETILDQDWDFFNTHINRHADFPQILFGCTTPDRSPSVSLLFRSSTLSLTNGFGPRICRSRDVHFYL